MNKVLIGIPTAPVLDFGEFNKAWPGNHEWDQQNRRWDRLYGRFNGPSTERQTAIRETWWKHQAPATCKFFMGRTALGQEWPDDTVILDCGDKYLFDLQEKIQGMCRWALKHDFDVMIKLDDDSFVFPDLVPFLQQTDVAYGGKVYNEYCVGGGPGYVVNRQAMEVMANAKPSEFPEWRYWEDRWFGEILHSHGIPTTSIFGFIDEPNTLDFMTTRLTWHPCSPKGMRQAYDEIYAPAGLCRAVE